MRKSFILKQLDSQRFNDICTFFYVVHCITVTQVLEACVKNCGHRFHVLVASQEFVEGVLVRSILPKNNPPTALHDRVLSLIQVCACSHTGQCDGNCLHEGCNYGAFLSLLICWLFSDIKKANHIFFKLPSNCLFCLTKCPKSKNTQFTAIENEGNQQIFTSDRLEPMNV